jgi:predicted PurR-regulated permease PerM
MPFSSSLPFYAKFALILITICLLFLVFYIASGILMPLLMALLFAILLRPLVIFFQVQCKLPNVIATLAGVILFVFFIGAIVFFISDQITDFADDLPRIRHNLAVHYQHLQGWIARTFNVSYKRQDRYIEQVAGDNGNVLVESTLTTFSATLLKVVLVPIYTFLMLLYRNLFKKFLAKLIDEKNHVVLIEIIAQIKIVVQSYIVGLLIEMGIVALLVSTGLMLIGVQYAILLGVITAMLNLIPYIGIFCASALAVVGASINSTSISVILGALAVNIVVHLIDNNYVVPKIVASKVKINALVSIVGVLIGNILAGVAGMFLAIPIIAILKVIFDRIEPLKPWGLLMSDELPRTYTWGRAELAALKEGNNGESEKEQEVNRQVNKESGV